MLDQVIAARTGPPVLSYGQRIARIVQQVSRIVALPALVMMLAGLVLFASNHGGADALEADRLLAHPALPPGQLLSRELVTGTGLMSAGLLALAFVPLITVLLVMVDTIRNRRWQETLVALAVAGILLLSIFLGRR